MSWTDTTLTTWGRSRFARSATTAPSDEAGLRDAVCARHACGVITYGGGRCYGDAALDDRGQTILTSALNSIVALDSMTGEVVCEAGVNFASLLDRVLPEGFCFPVSAATAQVTVGGAFANDIHSKNHHRVGSFGDHASWIDIMLASGELVRASRDENADIFHASLGGAGLTGTIMRVGFRLMRVPSRSADAEYRPLANVDAMIDMIEASRDTHEFLFGWVDAMATGRGLGRGILELGNLANSDEGQAPEPATTRIRFQPPSFLLHPAILRRITDRRYRKMPPGGRAARVHLPQFLFPIDNIVGFNRVYGRRGFYSIHTGFPRAMQRAGIVAVMEAITAARAGSFAAVMKPMRGPGAGLLSFPMEGMAYAIDLPRRSGVEALHKEIERITLDHGGRLYIAKDALMTAESFAAMFPRLDEFRDVLARIDPEGRFQSDMGRRLRLHP
ncbi:MAG: FAD-binding oxidoreductase [Alphaproteobacteria bacterium]